MMIAITPINREAKIPIRSMTSDVVNVIFERTIKTPLYMYLALECL